MSLAECIIYFCTLLLCSFFFFFLFFSSSLDLYFEGNFFAKKEIKQTENKIKAEFDCSMLS